MIFEISHEEVLKLDEGYQFTTYGKIPTSEDEMDNIEVSSE